MFVFAPEKFVFYALWSNQCFDWPPFWVFFALLIALNLVAIALPSQP